MKKLFIRFACYLCSLIWRIRYKVIYKGLDEVKSVLKSDPRGILFLPNHPAVFIDPVIVTAPLLPTFEVHPLVVEYMFYHPLVNWAARLVKAIPIPNFHTSFNSIKQRRAEKAFQKMSDGLKRGDHYLIYPSGTTKQSAKEVIGGAFGVHKLLSENPDCAIVLVRQTGLWGSLFSRAFTAGDVPNMTEVVRRSFWIVLKNLIFFLPRRRVTVEFQIAPHDFPRRAPKAVLNRWLEEWYNGPFQKPGMTENPGEPLNLVSYSFWKEDYQKGIERKEDRATLSNIPQSLKDEIIQKVAQLAKRSPQDIVPSQQLLADLGLDSLDLAELLSFLEERYNVQGLHPGELTTVSRLFLAAMKIYEAPEVQEHEWNLRRWRRQLPQERVEIPDGATIPEAFLRTCDHKLFDIAAADPKSGLVSYRKIKMSALLLSDKIRQLPGERVGVLLPSCVAVQVIILACQLAGKTPVMINWTVGGRHLENVVDISKVQVILSSWAFVDNVENIDISQIDDLLLYLEEMKSEISLWSVLKAEILSFLSSRRILALPKFSHLQEPRTRKEAVILFTSGTESMPKGVPLSHKNILSDLKGALEMIEISSNDRMLSVLPPFHSFGFSVTGLMPLLAGVKAVYYPNPTESKRLAKAVRRWQPTLLPAAPTFLKAIIAASDRSGLSSIRLVISGAEKAPQELFDLCLKSCPQARIVEGYGITECSPVISFNQEGIQEFGVGKAIPGVQIKIVDPDSHTPLNVGQVGLVLASGPNVFGGYLNKGAAEPFIEMGGSIWYLTGDLGKLDPDSNLILAGRLKRFVKAGGEMLSLAAIEEAIVSKIREQSGGAISELPQVVVWAGSESNGRPKLVLISTVPFEVFEVNHILRQKGFSNLTKIDRVVKVDQIPLTATGKVAYRLLDSLVVENG